MWRLRLNLMAYVPVGAFDGIVIDRVVELLPQFNTASEGIRRFKDQTEGRDSILV